MSSDKHNAFLRQHAATVGLDLIGQGTFAEQMVALESLTAALFGAVMTTAGKGRADAGAYLTALTDGIWGRLDTVLK